MRTQTAPTSSAPTAAPRSKKRKRLVIGGAALVVAAASAGAYAYWSDTGSGTGSASSGSTTPITVKQTSTITGLAPGLAAQTLSGNFDNPNAGPVYVTSVSVSIASVDKASGVSGTCNASDYTLGGSAPVGAEVPAGNGQGSWTGLTIQFNNKAGTNQNACKGATVNLAYTSN